MQKEASGTPIIHPQTQIDVFRQIEENYRQLDDGFDVAYAKCSTAKQKKRLREILSAAEDAYWAAVADALADNSSFVMEVRADLEKKNREVKRHLGDLRNIAEFLEAAAEATRLAAALARLAAI